MVTELLVDRRVDDGMKLISRLVRDGFDVTVAFWAKTRDEGLWFLYIASNSVNTATLGESYKHLYACLSKISDSPISLSDVKLVNSANPAAQAAIAARDALPGRVPIRLGPEILGGLAVAEVYIYPRIGPMTPNEIMQTVTGLMSRSGFIQPSQVVLHDGTTILAVPRGITTVGSSVQIEFLDTAGASRSIPLDQIASIQ